MEPTRRQRVVSSIILIIVLGTAMLLILRALPGDTQARLEEYRRHAEATRPTRKSMVTAERVVLVKGEAVTVKHHRLIYRGLADGSICLDMYILDLDAQHPYPKKIPKAVARKGFRLSYGQYQMVTANKKALTLKIVH